MHHSCFYPPTPVLTAFRFECDVHWILLRPGMQMGRIDLLRPWKCALVKGDGDLGMSRTCCNAAEEISGAASSHATLQLTSFIFPLKHTYSSINKGQERETHPCAQKNTHKYSLQASCFPGRACKSASHTSCCCLAGWNAHTAHMRTWVGMLYGTVTCGL